jgi:hypothetical protein
MFWKGEEGDASREARRQGERETKRRERGARCFGRASRAT